MDARGCLCFGIAGHPHDQCSLGQRIDRGFVDFCGTLGHVTMEKVAGKECEGQNPDGVKVASTCDLDNNTKSHNGL